MHNEVGSTSFDKNAIYEKLKNENISYAAWPKRILEEIVGLECGVGGDESVVRKSSLGGMSRSANMLKKPDLKSSLKISKQ